MDSSRTVAYHPNVVGRVDGTTKLRWPHNVGAYRLAEHDMACGSLLGSPGLQLKLKAGGAIGDVFCVAAGKALIRTFVLKHWDEQSGLELALISGHYFLFPEHQEHKYMLSNGVYVAERVFVSPEPDMAHYILEFSNDSEERQQIATYAFCQLAGDVNDALEVEYDEDLLALIACSKESAHLARAVGATRAPADYEVSLDHARAVSSRFPGPLSGSTDAPEGLTIGALRYSTTLDVDESATLEFRLCVSANGADDLKSAYRSAPTARQALALTQTRYHEVLARSVALTPCAEINRGVLWAKANMERVLSNGPQGWGFTNDPMNSSNCVGRDAAWFCAGSDYFNQTFSRECLLQFLRRQEQSGLIPEYFSLLDGKTEDFGLNVNDDTPLIVWSAWHHYQITGDASFLDRTYPALLRAGRYLASQRDKRGLVWCTSEKTGSPGIVGWRNVIKSYRLSGAVTEVNSECYAAFRAIAELARARADESTAGEFDALAEALRDAIETHLRNPHSGLYYLNIDVRGTPYTDVTADLVFPVMFGVAKRETAAAIVRRLSESDFWTVGGMRTVPHDAVNYSADAASGCLGGVWNGMTFWFVKASAEYMPDFAAQALRIGFENYARDPQRNNTVPGQFSEWLHGETLVNEGMELSPWFPPRYIWATIEGLLGLDCSAQRPRISPNLPSHWQWCGLRAMPYRGCDLTWFAARVPELRVWASQSVDSSAPVEVLEEDISDSVFCSGDDARIAALRDGSRIVTLVGNTSDRTITTALRIRNLTGSFSIRRFESLATTWSRSETMSARDFEQGHQLVLEPKGFAVIELRSL